MELTRTELIRTELVRTELIRTELIETELIRTELTARVKIRQLKELKVFNSLRLSMVVTTEVAAGVLAKVTTKVLAEVKASLVVYYLNSSVS